MEDEQSKQLGDRHLGNANTEQPVETRTQRVPAAQDSAELAGVLLPQEHVVFGSRPHPIVILRPLIAMGIAFASACIDKAVRVHPIVRGHHVAVSFITVPNGALIAVVAALVLLAGLVKLMQAAAYYSGYRCIATNRRVFVMDGILGRRLRPIVNASTASAGLTQSWLGRHYDFGTIYTNFGALGDMREPVPLYRAIQAVANGVQGDTWTAAARHTIVP